MVCFGQEQGYSKAVVTLCLRYRNTDHIRTNWFGEKRQGGFAWERSSTFPKAGQLSWQDPNTFCSCAHRACKCTWMMHGHQGAMQVWWELVLNTYLTGGHQLSREQEARSHPVTAPLKRLARRVRLHRFLAFIDHHTSATVSWNEGKPVPFPNMFYHILQGHNRGLEGQEGSGSWGFFQLWLPRSVSPE